MNKTRLIVPILILCLLAPTACRAEKSTTAATTPTTLASFLPSTRGAPDFIMLSIGRVIYEGDDGMPGETPIQIVGVTLGSGADTANITYRKDIETNAGQTRNNILYVAIDDRTITVVPTIVGLPAGIIPKVDDGGRGLNGTFWQQVIEFGVGFNVKAGKYDFKIDININGTDYGTIPCTINVT